MRREDEANLWKLLDELAKEKCAVNNNISNACCKSCPFFIDTLYSGECAIGIVQDNI